MSSYNTKNINKKISPKKSNNFDDDADANSIGKHIIDQKEKLPLKSIIGRRCLTKCYPKGQVYLHPILLTAIGERTNNSCAIDPVHSRDVQYHKLHDVIWADTCRLDDNKIYQPPDELESMLLSFYFNPRDFLSSIYDLHSFDQVIYWSLENDYLPFDTIKRVQNCAWKVYGDKIEEITNTVIEYYYNISKNYWLKDYAKIIQNDYSFDFVGNKPVGDIKDGTEGIYDILYTKFYTWDFFVSAIKRYVYEYDDKWELIESHYANLKKYLFGQLIEHIENVSASGSRQ